MLNFIKKPSNLICTSNQVTGFYMKRTPGWNGLIAVDDTTKQQMGFKVIICAAHVKANNLSRDQGNIQNCFDKTT